MTMALPFRSLGGAPGGLPAPPEKHPAVETSDQIVEALDDLQRDASAFTHWPYPDLDHLTGPMAPGDVWFVCARSGGGKTTFVSSCIMRWLEQGKKLYVLPLETRPKSFRTYLACIQAGIQPGMALSGALRSTPQGQMARKTLEGLLMAQLHEPTVSRLRVNGAEAISADLLPGAFDQAADFGADIVLIDHIDHVQAADRGNDLYGASVAVNKQLLKLAQRYSQLVVATSQLNLNVAHGDALTRYQPPRDQDVYLGNFKRTVCTGMIGLFRPVRTQRPGESTEEYAEVVRSARKGLTSPQEALEPDMMGVVAMKLRNFGQRENERCFLGVRDGRCVTIQEKGQVG